MRREMVSFDDYVECAKNYFTNFMKLNIKIHVIYVYYTVPRLYVYFGARRGINIC